VLFARVDVVYVIDVGRSTLAAAAAAAARRIPYVIDTGDAAYELARSTGSHGRVGEGLVGLGEALVLRGACHVVVRGREHVGLLPHARATVVPDVAPATARPVSGAAVRRELDLADAFVVGLVGSLVHAPRLGISYGWDVVEALDHTDRSVHALIVGDGDGLAALEARAIDLGVSDRCRFVGRVHPDDVARYVAAMDVGVSTQSNDAVGRVRTTGKLPLYLACGLPVLATDVGEAHYLLGPLGWTLPYTGVVDRAHPRRLAEAVERWRRDTEGAGSRREAALTLSREAFDPTVMARRVAEVVQSCTRDRRSSG
jgi:glycosyltransferase involved in cell wall biosynthesis